MELIHCFISIGQSLNQHDRVANVCNWHVYDVQNSEDRSDDACYQDVEGVTEELVVGDQELVAQGEDGNPLERQ